MEKKKVKVMFRENFKGKLPKYESALSSGFDIRAQIDEPIRLAVGERCLVPTGLSFEIPEGYEIQVRPRSGLAIQKGMTLLNTPGTIDADYRGEVKIIVSNLGTESFEIKDQDRIAQCVLCPVYQAEFKVLDKLSQTPRGEGGFGSTGD